MTEAVEQPATPIPAALSLRGAVGVRRFFANHAMALVFPITFGLALYGWRALVAVGVVVAAAAAGLAVWGRVGMRGRRISLAHGIWLALVLAVIFPAQLAAWTFPGAGAGAGGAGTLVWAVLAGAGLALALLLWLFGGVGSGRVHPVLVIYLLCVVLFQNLLVPRFVLHRAHVVSGDVLDAIVAVAPPGGSNAPIRKEAWTTLTDTPVRDALYVQPASEKLMLFTTGRQAPDRAALSLDELIRDRMPPLEDLIVGGQPAPIGLGSAVAVIMGGLFLLYRGLIDFRVPLLIFIAAVVTLLLLPIPVAITENVRHWRSLAIQHTGVGWSTAITFVNYELMAGPLLFVAFFLAAGPGVRPMTRRGRAVYAVLIGAGAATAQLYLDVSYGPYLALLVVGLLTPLLDRIFLPRPLV
jgi:Na+-translocating ferredoxin:NAD+ oxidoreductase RnfD subunit